jgi:hypothetical protein
MGFIYHFSFALQITRIRALDDEDDDAPDDLFQATLQTERTQHLLDRISFGAVGFVIRL